VPIDTQNLRYMKRVLWFPLGTARSKSFVLLNLHTIYLQYYASV